MSTRMIGALAAISMIGGANAAAQTVVVNNRLGGYAYDSTYSRLYNPASVITFSGRVTGIQLERPRAGMADGVVLLVKAPNGGTAIVEMGPTWFVNNQPGSITTGTQVKVTGSKIITNGRGTIIASQVTAGNNVFALRAPNGRPFWDIYDTAEYQVAPGLQVVNGVVDTVRNFDGSSGLVLRTNNGLLNVDLGPQWFWQPQGVAFQPGANLTVVTGPGTFSVGPNGQPIPAYGLQYNNQNFFLRNSAGRPIWIGFDWQSRFGR